MIQRGSDIPPFTYPSPAHMLDNYLRLRKKILTGLSPQHLLPLLGSCQFGSRLCQSYPPVFIGQADRSVTNTFGYHPGLSQMCCECSAEIPVLLLRIIVRTELFC
ncbi:hypothetical protein AMECASPLE_023688 [Ameca splendens]|uniref:Uncharacterized protein n=1 Tax=Ameca splendens TaxID=208324 RepID=A0ABV0Z2Z9_9TELE